MCLVRAIFASRYQNPDRLAAQRDAGRIDHGRYGAEHRIRPSCVDVVLFPFDRRQLLRKRQIRLLQVLWADLRVHTLHAENQIAPPEASPPQQSTMSFPGKGMRSVMRMKSSGSVSRYPSWAFAAAAWSNRSTVSMGLNVRFCR